MDLLKVREVINNASDLTKNIAADVWPGGGILKCEKCGKEKLFTQKTAARFLNWGWPQCCGYTMALKR